MAENKIIVCFCEECCEEFKSYIAKDICPICAKISNNTLTKPNYEPIKRQKRYEE